MNENASLSIRDSDEVPRGIEDKASNVLGVRFNVEHLLTESHLSQTNTGNTFPKIYPLFFSLSFLPFLHNNTQSTPNLTQ